MASYDVTGGSRSPQLCPGSVRSRRWKRSGAIFRAWVRFVQVKRRDFTSASVTKNAVVCGAHFRPGDYHPSDMMEFRMGCRCPERVRLSAGSVPSVHTAAPSGPPSAAAPAAGGLNAHGSVRGSAQRKRQPCADLGDPTDAPTASAAVHVDPEEEAFSPPAPQPSVLHFGSQCNLKPSHHSSGCRCLLELTKQPAAILDGSLRRSQCIYFY
ncbi:uncharacterized protein LOC115369185 [Myripristis murdjan]|uniref:uncharacterized protein LOC115369185 n=1 Tax=Myripristis murdjan TaxID=586833 RepID=UPI0011762334|nr:uncharacterized protein LOC115369185 [Myripristis murdjan]